MWDNTILPYGVKKYDVMINYEDTDIQRTVDPNGLAIDEVVQVDNFDIAFSLYTKNGTQIDLWAYLGVWMGEIKILNGVSNSTTIKTRPCTQEDINTKMKDLKLDSQTFEPEWALCIDQ